ncbi:MAG TPA: alpha-L-fucosidase [Lacipirellulaceae bacterium]|nr:alpha-L-fucosidase [Lacipirellulaceae bacterium]
MILRAKFLPAGCRPLASALAAAVVLAPAWATAQEGRRDDAPRAQTLRELGETLSPDVEYPDQLDRMAVHQALTGGLPHESRGEFGMSPHATPEQVREALARVEFPAVEGPFEPTWQSIYDNYKLPSWLEQGKFGIFIHFGLYSIPAHHNEWYQKHMYGNGGIRNWHIEHFGPLDKFGYKDFIPMFTLPEFRPDEWAEAFAQSGARWVMPTAEHHDGYSLWDSEVNRFNSVKTGPKRDFVRELGDAVRAQGMKYGVTNHTIEHYDFIEPDNVPDDMATDLKAEGYEDFYWTTHNDQRMVEHLVVWLKKNIELIDKYRPAVLWFDNGVNHRVFDPMKLKVVAYYYNRARQWGEEVTVTGKGTAFVAGDLQDFEGMGRAPRGMADYTWLAHDTLTGVWGYIEGARAKSADAVVRTLVECVCRRGVYALNVSPKGDGSIPADQVASLRGIGDWLKVNGEAIYGATVWNKPGEGSLRIGGRYSGKDIRFTKREGNLYAIVMGWPEGGKAVITSLPAGGPAGQPSGVTLLGSDAAPTFKQDETGLAIALPAEAPGKGPWVLRIEGLTL